MQFQCNLIEANGWEPSYFGFILNGIFFSIGFYAYNMSIISNTLGDHNYYITVLQLSITRFSIIVLIVWIIEVVFQNNTIYQNRRGLMILSI